MKPLGDAAKAVAAPRGQRQPSAVLAGGHDQLGGHTPPRGGRVQML